MRNLLVAIVFFTAASASADRYWDVPEEHATAIAKALEGELVLEYCSGCGDIFSLYRVKSAAVKKGDYSKDKQVHIERTILMSGIDKAPFTFEGTCGVTAEHLEENNKRVDIPYAFWRKGGQWRWIGEGRLDGRAPVLKISPAAQQNIDKCAGKIAKAKDGNAPKKQNGSYTIEGAKVTLSSGQHKTERVRKGRKVTGAEPALKMTLALNKKKHTLVAPMHFAITKSELVWAKPVRKEFLVAAHGQNEIAHVFFHQSKGGSWQAHIVPRERDDEELSFGEGEFKFDRKRNRFVAKRTRFPMTDDLNFRERPKNGKIIGKLDRGAVVLAITSDYDAFAFAQVEGVEGFVWRELLVNVAPLVDARSGQYLHLSEAEALASGLSSKTLKQMRGWRREVLEAKTTQKLCKLLPKLQGEHKGLFDKLETRWFNGDLPGDDIAKRISRIVPGFRFQGWDGGLLHRVHYSAFAATLDSKAVTDVLRAAETFDNPFPRWVLYKTDFGGCTKPKKAKLAIELLERSWSKVPACLQAQLKKPIKTGLDRLSTTHCYCDSKAQMNKAWKKNKTLIKKLAPEFSPDGLLKNIDKGLSDSKFNQECAPG